MGVLIRACFGLWSAQCESFRAGLRVLLHDGCGRRSPDKSCSARRHRCAAHSTCSDLCGHRLCAEALEQAMSSTIQIGNRVPLEGAEPPKHPRISAFGGSDGFLESGLRRYRLALALWIASIV